MGHSRLKIASVLVIVAIILSIPVAVTHFRNRAKARQGKAIQPPVPVSMAEVVRKDAPVEAKTFGTVEANQSVSVKPQVGGVLTDVIVGEGQDVKKGAPLFTVDPRPYEATLNQAKATLSRDVAQYVNATNEARRQVELWNKGVASEDARDSARTAAQVLEAAVRAGEAAVSNATLHLQYCFVTSPIDGRTGEIFVDAGNAVKANETTVITINQVMPVRVAFALPQQELPAVMRRMAEGKITVTAIIPGDENKPEEGEVVFVDNAVNKGTGTIGLKAAFANAGRRLWPGQFVKVVARLGVDKDAIVVPAQAVQSGQRGSYVFVVKADASVENRPIIIGRTMGENVTVSKGLEVGEKIVTDGQLRIFPGAKVEPAGAGKEKPAGGKGTPK